MKKLLFIAWIGAFTGDGASTDLVLAHGGYEAVYTQSAVANNYILTGESIGALYLANKYWKSHPKLVKLALLTGIAVETYQTQKNMKALKLQISLNKACHCGLDNR